MNKLSKSCLVGLLLAVAARAAELPQDAGISMPPRIACAELGPQHNGKDVTMSFTVAGTYWISGTVPVGQTPSFGITPVLAEGSPRFGVLVSGDLADVMNRFNLAAPSNVAMGLVIEATGQITVFPAPDGNPAAGPSFQLTIRDWKKFRIIPDPKPRGA
jgi:hypothetical protein